MYCQLKNECKEGCSRKVLAQCNDTGDLGEEIMDYILKSTGQRRAK